MANTTNLHNLWSVESVDGDSRLCHMQIFDHAQSGLPTPHTVWRSTMYVEED